MSEDDRVRFDRIDYVTLGSDDVPVQRSCPTFYERFTDGRPASQFEFQASPEFFDLLPGWLANLAGAAPSSFRRRAALPRPGRHLPLDGWFNAEHADHLHAEGIGAPLLDKSARSATLFCQQVCNRVFGNALVSDGVWGDKTQAAMDQAQARIGVGGDLAADSGAWRQWLRAVAEIALQGRMAP